MFSWTSVRGPKPKPLAVRFWAKVQKTRTCWLWIASVSGDGYGQIGRGPPRHTMLKAHRVSWTLYKGPIPRGLCVLHKCDVKRCVRPSHLFLGTDADNVRDMTRKGRNVFQLRNPSLKLSPAKVRSIRRARARGELLRVISARFGVTEGTVSRIVNGVRRGGVK